MKTEDVVFYSEGTRLEGRLHLPDGQQKEPYAVLVQGPGWLGTMCSRLTEPYHEGFTGAGYAVLTFNYRGWGGSDGDRSTIHPRQQVEDIRSAITYAETRPEIDPSRIGLWGLGGTGAGNAICAAAEEDRVRAVIVQAVVADGEDWLRSMRREHEWVEFKQQVREDWRARVATGQGTLVDPTVDIMVATPERRAVKQPTYGGDFHLSSAIHLMSYKPIDVVERVSPAALLITSLADDWVAPEEHAIALYERAGSPKRLIRQRGFTHYTQFTENFPLLMHEFSKWLGEHLAPYSPGLKEIREQ